jgi:hypothetical protein
LDVRWYSFVKQTALVATNKLTTAKSILQEQSNYEWLTSSENFMVLNNGIEFSMTNIIMLSLFFTGADKYCSIDFFLTKIFIVKT